jgi:transposase
LSDSDAIRQHLLMHGILPVIPAKRGRRHPAVHDQSLYRLRNRVERRISRLKATHYDKTALSFPAFIHLAACRV